MLHVSQHSTFSFITGRSSRSNSAVMWHLPSSPLPAFLPLTSVFHRNKSYLGCALRTALPRCKPPAVARSSLRLNTRPPHPLNRLPAYSPSFILPLTFHRRSPRSVDDILSHFEDHDEQQLKLQKLPSANALSRGDAAAAEGAQSSFNPDSDPNRWTQLTSLTSFQLQ